MTSIDRLGPDQSVSPSHSLDDKAARIVDALDREADTLRAEIDTLIGDEAGALHSRRGMTLLELLVSMGVIALLVAILLPAVHAARESARKTSCVSKLRQIGLAARMYHNASGVFPAAIPFTGTRRVGPTVHQALLPYLEQPDPENPKDPHPPVYLCESTSQMPREHHLFLGYNAVMYAPSVGTNGMNYDQPTDGAFGGRPTHDGCFFDGLSHTIFFGEIIGRDARGAGFTLGTHTGQHAPINHVNPDLVAQPAFVPPGAELCESSRENPCIPITGPDRQIQARHGMRSSHDGGAHAVFADGHAGFLSDMIDAEVLKALGTKARREIVHSADW